MATPTSNQLTVTKNILRFADEVRRCPGLADRLASFRAWYAVQNRGRWHFGPSKYIGYVGLDGTEYLSLTSAGKLNGRATEERLQAFFRTVDENTTLYDELNVALCEFLGEFDKYPCRSNRINIANDAHDERYASDGDHVPLVDLIVAVARSLPPSQVRELRKRMKTVGGWETRTARVRPRSGDNRQPKSPDKA